MYKRFHGANLSELDNILAHLNLIAGKIVSVVHTEARGWHVIVEVD